MRSTRSLPDSKPMETVFQLVSWTSASNSSGHWRTVSARAAAQYGHTRFARRGYFSSHSSNQLGFWKNIESWMTSEPTPYSRSRSLSSSMTISTGRRPMLGMYEFSLQNTHCQGHTRLVMSVTTGGGPQPHSGSSGQLNLRASFPDAGLGHSVRSILGQSAIEADP